LHKCFSNHNTNWILLEKQILLCDCWQYYIQAFSHGDIGENHAIFIISINLTLTVEHSELHLMNILCSLIFLSIWRIFGGNMNTFLIFLSRVWFFFVCPHRQTLCIPGIDIRRHPDNIHCVFHFDIKYGYITDIFSR
jgi:hypothetical protein